MLFLLVYLNPSFILLKMLINIHQTILLITRILIPLAFFLRYHYSFTCMYIFGLNSTNSSMISSPNSSLDFAFSSNNQRYSVSKLNVSNIKKSRHTGLLILWFSSFLLLIGFLKTIWLHDHLVLIPNNYFAIIWCKIHTAIFSEFSILLLNTATQHSFISLIKFISTTFFAYFVCSCAYIV